MLSADGRLAIVFNGEIYNFRELRSELAQLGCAFHSDSDTEAILAAYAMWGEQCLNRFNGMFSFAIYDRGAGSEPATLFLHAIAPARSLFTTPSARTDLSSAPN